MEETNQTTTNGREGLEQRQKIIANITAMYDVRSGEKIPIQSIGVDFGQNKYSAKKLAVWLIMINGRRLVKQDPFKFDYKCCTCDSKHQLVPISLIRKVNKCPLECVNCVNSIEEKRRTHSENFYTYKDRPKPTEIVAKSYIQKRDEALDAFNQMDDDYKAKYFGFHLTTDDYTRILPRIQCFHNGKITDLANIEYWPVYNSMNQMTFTSIMYNLVTQTVFKPHQPILKCDVCSGVWRAKSLECYKNHVVIKCRTCSLVNTSFPILVTTNNINQRITYQSKLELKFIKWCEANGLTVTNGPILPYEFGEKKTTYRVDFCIGRIMIEIKDFHEWHRNDIASGKWAAKESAALEQVRLGNYDRFMMITPKTWLASLKELKTTCGI